MRLLFVVRGEPDFERFVAIAPHLQGEELIFVAPDPATVIEPTIHWALFKSLRLDCQKFDDWNGDAERKGIAAFLASVNPDVAIFDQFGPSCAHQVVKMRDSAFNLGIPVCMVPHGVRVVDIRDLPQATPRLGKVADVVFYTSAYHFARAGPVLSPPGSRFAILGDPRLDRSHLDRLRTFPRAEMDVAGDSNKNVRLAFFGARIEMPLLDVLRCVWPLHDSNDLNQRMLEALLADKSINAIAKPHPRLGPWPLRHAAARWISDRVGTLDAIASVDIVATPSSSVALEALILGKRIITINFQKVAPDYRSIFEGLECRPFQCDCALDLWEVLPDDAFLNAFCWAGFGPVGTAKRYAEAFLAVAQNTRLFGIQTA